MRNKFFFDLQLSVRKVVIVEWIVVYKIVCSKVLVFLMVMFVGVFMVIGFIFYFFVIVDVLFLQVLIYLVGGFCFIFGFILLVVCGISLFILLVMMVMVKSWGVISW